MFSERLKQLRKKTGLTQEELSSKLGIARTTYSGYERGTSEPDFDTITKFSEFFKVNLNWLITGSDKVLDVENEKVVEKFSKLSDKGQDYILELMEKMIEQNK